MSLLAKEKAEIQNNYFSVWEIVEFLKQDEKNSWEEVGTFLGYHDFVNELCLYESDEFHRIYGVHQFHVIIQLIDDLRQYWLIGDDGLNKTKRNVSNYYWSKEDIHQFKPLVDLSFENSKLTLKKLDSSENIEHPTVQTDYKFYFFKQVLLNSTECACIVSEQNPLGIVDVDRFNMAQKLIYSAIASGDLEENEHLIKADNLKLYLSSCNIIIAGFNDEVKTLSENENKTLKLKIKELEKVVKDQKILINQMEIKKSKEKIGLLEQIFDDSLEGIHAPDLVLAIKLWESIYINSPKEQDSHSNKANTWIRSNTDYDVDKKTGSAAKIREITTPFIHWSPHRDKKHKKKI